MTVIYAAYSKSSRNIFIGADDLEGNQKLRVNKIRFFMNRFVIAVAGSDNPINGITGQNSLEDLEQEISSPQILVEEISSWTKDYTKSQIEKFSNGTVEEKGSLANAQDSSTLVIFDTKTFELYRCDLGLILPPENIVPANMSLILLSENVVHLFAMTTNRVFPQNFILLGVNDFSNPDAALRKLIKLDQDWHKVQNTMRTSSFFPDIGELGARFFYESGNPKFVTI